MSGGNLRSRVARLERAGSDNLPVVAVLTRGKSRREANRAALAEAEALAAERGVRLVVVSLPPGPGPAPPGGGMDLAEHLSRPWPPKPLPPGVVPS